MSPRWTGVLVAALTLVIDQANKLWLLNVFGIEDRQPVHLAPFFDVIAARNTGISYSLLSGGSLAGRWALVAFTALAILVIGVWLWRTKGRLTVIALGLIIGGAIGNGIDRISYGWVADFYYFHLGWFHWYVFNLADVAIVLGVVLLLFESFFVAPKRTDIVDSQV